VDTPQPSLADRIDAVLPQTQCTRCGFAACRPYADALAAGGSDINRCPPGGERVIKALAALTGRAAKALDPECGAEMPLLVAVIDEATCIGCTLCIQACPVDAILGAQKRMHTVLPSLCSGCELCVAPCPVDCITLQPVARAWTDDDAAKARERFVGRAARLARNERVARRTVPPASASAHLPADRARRQAAVADALARARARRRMGSPAKP
jgi:electron transport complex protein RnfB